jgi:hypothetical protein
MVPENPLAIEIIEIGYAASVAFWGHVNERALGVIRKCIRRFNDHELMTSRIPILRLTEEASCGGCGSDGLLNFPGLTSRPLRAWDSGCRPSYLAGASTAKGKVAKNSDIEERVHTSSLVRTFTQCDGVSSGISIEVSGHSLFP